MTSRTRLVALITPFAIAFGAACAGGPKGPQPIPEHPDITGTWLLNPEFSKNPNDDEPSRPPSNETPGPSRTRTPAGIESFLPSVAFRIEERDSVLIFSDAQGRERTIYQDERQFVEPVEGLGNLTVTAQWKGDKFVIRRQLQSGPTITETYELAEEGRQLRVKIRIFAQRAIDFLRVYDRSDTP